MENTEELQPKETPQINAVRVIDTSVASESRLTAIEKRLQVLPGSIADGIMGEVEKRIAASEQRKSPDADRIATLEARVEALVAYVAAEHGAIDGSTEGAELLARVHASSSPSVVS